MKILSVKIIARKNARFIERETKAAMLKCWQDLLKEAELELEFYNSKKKKTIPIKSAIEVRILDIEYAKKMLHDIENSVVNEYTTKVREIAEKAIESDGRVQKVEQFALIVFEHGGKKFTRLKKI